MDKKFLTPLLLIFLTSGCASLLSDNRYAISISSSPPNAFFQITDNNKSLVYTGFTPATVRLKSSKGYFKPAKYTLSFENEGYQDHLSSMNGKIDNLYWGNILLGGAIGMAIIDPLTGSMWALPRHYSVQLKPDMNDIKLGIGPDDSHKILENIKLSKLTSDRVYLNSVENISQTI